MKAAGAFHDTVGLGAGQFGSGVAVGVRVGRGVIVGGNVTVGADVGVGSGGDPHAASQTAKNASVKILFNKIFDSFKSKCAAIVP